MGGRGVSQGGRLGVEIDVGGGDELFWVFPQRTAFIPDKSVAGSVALARCEVAASLTIDAIKAAGTPWPDTSAMRKPA